MQWSLVIPVKGSIGKSRLAAGDARPALAVAFARDTITAARQSASVDRIVVVTSDAKVTEELEGVQVVDDPGGSLHAAIAAGVAALDPAAPAAVLLGDLPALTAADLDAGLELAAAEPRAYVADGLATGTTMLTARRADALRPRFGPGSADRHRRAGHVELPVAPGTGLRLDVDELADLHTALDVGVGPHTCEVLQRASIRV